MANRVIQGTAAFSIVLMTGISVVSADTPAPDTAPMQPSEQASDSFYSSVSPPETLPQLLKLLVRLARSGVFSRGDFYTKDSMSRLFSTNVTSRVDDDGIVTVVSAHGYQSLVAGPDENTRQSPYLSGIWISARKPNANGWPFCCRLDAEFWGDIPGLDFKSVIETLGSHWREDRRGEAQVAISRAEPFNPPPKPTTGYMANAIIVYESAPATRISLDFDSAGRLHSFYAEWPKIPSEAKQAAGRPSSHAQ